MPIIIAVSMFPAEGFTVMRMCLDRARIVRKLHEQVSRAAVSNEILRIWMASLGLNLIEGILFWDYDEQSVDFRKCSRVSRSCPVPKFQSDLSRLFTVSENSVGERGTVPIYVFSRILLYSCLCTSLSHNDKG